MKLFIIRSASLFVVFTCCFLSSCGSPDINDYRARPSFNLEEVVTATEVPSPEEETCEPLNRKCPDGTCCPESSRCTLPKYGLGVIDQDNIYRQFSCTNHICDEEEPIGCGPELCCATNQLCTYIQAPFGQVGVDREFVCGNGCPDGRSECFNEKLGVTFCCNSGEICDRGRCEKKCDGDRQVSCGVDCCDLDSDEICIDSFKSCFIKNCEGSRVRCGDSCCNEDEYCSNKFNSCKKKDPKCTEDQTKCQTGPENYDCCEAHMRCMISIGSDYSSCENSTLNRCKEGQIECGHKGCCDLGTERCGSNKCSPKCNQGEVVCRDSCCPEGTTCLSDGGCCPKGSMACGRKCCAAGQSCYDDKCIKMCASDEIPCGENCCDSETEACRKEKELLRTGEEEIEIDVLSCFKKCELGTKQCGLGGLCCNDKDEECISAIEDGRTINKCAKSCSINSVRCGETCCDDTEECVTAVTSNGFSSKKCVPPCPNKTLMTYRCGDGTECCEKDECGYDDIRQYDENKLIIGCNCGWTFHSSCNLQDDNGNPFTGACCTCTGSSAVQADGTCKQKDLESTQNQDQLLTDSGIEAVPSIIDNSEGKQSKDKQTVDLSVGADTDLSDTTSVHARPSNKGKGKGKGKAKANKSKTSKKDKSKKKAKNS
jgi:hypothetical protein